MKSLHLSILFSALIVVLTACSSLSVGTSEQVATDVGDFIEDLPATETQPPSATNTSGAVETEIVEQDSTNDGAEFFAPIPVYEAPNMRVDDSRTYNISASIPPDGIRPIYEPRFVPAVDAPLADDELVIGVAWGGEAKAYSITVLRFREMVNDELAGLPMLVTW